MFLFCFSVEWKKVLVTKIPYVCNNISGDQRIVLRDYTINVRGREGLKNQPYTEKYYVLPPANEGKLRSAPS